jgi:prepilin-type N-terminal cleavage/methylation domain-containing protein
MIKVFNPNYIVSNRAVGFTLAELLIALSVLGVISVFSIPKIVASGQNNAKNAATREIISVLSQGFMKLKQEGKITINTRPDDILTAGELNYAREMTSGLIDRAPGQPDVDCADIVHRCYQLHNGGVVLLHKTATFMGTAANDAITFWFDPDGTYSGSLTGPGKGILLLIYFNGRITTMSGISNPTNTVWGSLTPSAQEPEWFSWQ